MSHGPLRSMIALILAVTVTAMGFAAATARGQTAAGGQVVVFCSGGGLVQITLDADGNPTGDSHLCPDLASFLLAAHALAPVEAVCPETPSDAVTPRYAAYVPFARRTIQRARGPPAEV